MPSHGWKVLASLALAFCLAQAVNGKAAERPLRVAYTALDAVFLPVWATKEAGYFEKYKVSVELLSIRSSALCLAATLAGDLDICAGGTLPVVSANLQGQSDLILFGTLNNKAGFWVYSNPAITDVSGLRGKRFGVTRFGGALDFISRYFLKNSGLDPRKDVSMIQVGSTPDIVVALAGRSIDAGTLSLPSNLQAKKLGFRELADLTDVGASYPSAGLTARKQFLIDNKIRMENFSKALIEGIHFIRTNREESLRILSKYTKVSDPESLAAAYDLHVKKIWLRVPELNPEDLKPILEQAAETNPKAHGLNPSSFIYDPFLKDVIKTGFVERLYK